MSIPIPIGELHGVTAAGSRPVVVHCESCSHTYGYLLARRVTGHGFSPVLVDDRQAKEDAAKAARNSLAYSMTNDCDAIPCPSCGHLQAAMLERVRRRVVRTTTTLAAFPILVAGILAAYFRGNDLYAVASFCGLLAFGFGLKGVLSHWNPDTSCFKRFLDDKTALLPDSDLKALLQPESLEAVSPSAAGEQQEPGVMDAKASIRSPERD